MSEKTRKEWCENESQNALYFSWLLGQLPWKRRRIKVIHLSLNFSYTVDPLGKNHLQTEWTKASLGSTLLSVHEGKFYLHQFMSWNIKLWSPYAPRAFRHSLPLPEEGELCCLFHLGLSEADVKLEPCLTWQWEYFGHRPRSTIPVWGFGCTPCHVPHWNHFRIFSTFIQYSRTSCHSSTLSSLYLLTRPVTMLSTEENKNKYTAHKHRKARELRP